jgi:toxin ParE1/3/4
MDVRLSYLAEQDLLDISTFIAADSPRQAQIYIDKLIRACAELAEDEERYALIPRYENRGYRRRPFENYAIIYVVNGEDVTVVRITSSARDLEALLGD